MSTQGLHIEWPFSISTEDMRLFSELSGDGNPLHSDSNLHKLKGTHIQLSTGVALRTDVTINLVMPDKNSIIMEISWIFVALFSNVLIFLQI